MYHQIYCNWVGVINLVFFNSIDRLNHCFSGIGKFCIVDNEIVMEEDLGSK